MRGNITSTTFDLMFRGVVPILTRQPLASLLVRKCCVVLYRVVCVLSASLHLVHRTEVDNVHPVHPVHFPEDSRGVVCSRLAAVVSVPPAPLAKRYELDDRIYSEIREKCW